jgi:hypothetical protein
MDHLNQKLIDIKENMLIEKPIAEGDVVSIKLINGDELIARLEKDDHNGITINRPLALTMSSGGLGMIPWVFLGAKESMTLKREHVFVMIPSKKDAADQYMQGTTGIALS